MDIFNKCDLVAPISADSSAVSVPAVPKAIPREKRILMKLTHEFYKKRR